MIHKHELAATVFNSARGNLELGVMEDFNDASQKYLAFCRLHSLEPRDAGTCYVWKDGSIVATVSFNGRVCFKETVK